MKVSIIIPAYNIENYIERCIDSIIPQIDDNYEIIIVDDGSKDNTYAKLKCVQNKYPKYIKILSQKNSGLSSARNAGLRVSIGEYIWFVDGDDYIIDNTIPQIYNYLKCSHPSVLAFNYIKKHPNHNQECRIFKSNKILPSYIFLLQDSSLFVWNKIYHKQAIGNLTFFEGANNIEDFVFNTELLPKVAVIHTLPLLVNVYDNTNYNSNSRNRSKKHLLRLSQDTFIIHIKLFNEFKIEPNSKVKDSLMSLLNLSVAGHIYSLLRLYNLRHVYSAITFYKQCGLYPIGKCKNKKANLFIMIANIPLLFKLFCNTYRFIIYLKQKFM